MGKLRGLGCCLIFVTLTATLLVGILPANGGFWNDRLNVRFVATPEEVVIEILKTAEITPADIVYDLGCGDGRIVIAAAKNFGARGVGVDLDPLRIEESNENARRAGVTDRVRFMRQDLFQTDIREATVVTLYLLESLNLKLRPKLLRDLRPGTRILSHEFGMGEWKPDKKGTVRKVPLYYQPESPSIKDTNYYYWVVPADVAGEWKWTLPAAKGRRDFTLRLVQHFQQIHGELEAGGREASITDAQLVGEQLRFTFRDDADQQKSRMQFKGRVTGDTIAGSIKIQRGTTEAHHLWQAKRTLRISP